MPDHNLTLFEACEYLVRSKKTVGRYIRTGRLSPIQIKSQQGTLEYRFNQEDLERLKAELSQDMGQLKAPAPYVANISQNEPEKSPETPTLSTPPPPFTASHENVPKSPTQDNEVITILKDMNTLLKGQLEAKDSQIAQLLDRGRETNILLLKAQEKIQALEQPKERYVPIAGYEVAEG